MNIDPSNWRNEFWEYVKKCHPDLVQLAKEISGGQLNNDSIWDKEVIELIQAGCKRPLNFLVNADEESPLMLPASFSNFDGCLLPNLKPIADAKMSQLEIREEARLSGFCGGHKGFSPIFPK